MKVCLDSRLVQPNDYFVPVKGEEFDGHKFIDAAIDAGAKGIIEELDIIAGLSKLQTPKGRLRIIDGIGGSIIIDDTYNSSPISVQCALDAVVNNMKGRKIAVLGGMLELGKFEDSEHKIVGEALSKLEFDEVALVGELARKIPFTGHTHLCETSDKTVELIRKVVKPREGDIILVKASQGIRLEKVVEGIMKYPDQAEKLLVRQDARWK